MGDDDGGDALVDESEPIQPLQQQEAEDYSDPNWEPEPMDAGPGRPHAFCHAPIRLSFWLPTSEFRTNKPSDIISTLVSIYDSRDLFIKELQVLLAQRLLAIKDGADRVEKEVSIWIMYLSSWPKVLESFPFQRKNIEILKIRFGEAALQVCEVMLKDMTDSKRTDVHVQSQTEVISNVYQPSLI